MEISLYPERCRRLHIFRPQHGQRRRDRGRAASTLCAALEAGGRSVTVGVLRAFGDWVVVREGSFAVVSVSSEMRRLERLAQVAPLVLN